jgi:drug/metabolite transporter (DMT)-like permease
MNDDTRARSNGMTLGLFLALLAGSLCAAGGTFLLKLGAMNGTGLMDFVNLKIFAGLALYGLGSATWIYCMSRAPLSMVYPFNALTFVLVMISAFVLLGEKPSLASVGGSLLILSGIGWIALGAMA